MILLAAGTAVCLGACTTATKQAKASCQQRDWYEVGRRDGAGGAGTNRLHQYKMECGEGFSTSYETLYMNGRNAGLVEFCMPENAFELARMGINYLYVCPSTMEEDFLTSYRKGQQARILMLKKRDLDTQIESLTQRLLATSAGTTENREIGSQLEELKKLRSDNERELTQITK
jgi:hypothetical protein